jgi:hypothetical protein
VSHLQDTSVPPAPQSPTACIAHRFALVHQISAMGGQLLLVTIFRLASIQLLGTSCRHGAQLLCASTVPPGQFLSLHWSRCYV